MLASEVEVGMRVLYYPYPGAKGEAGTVRERREAGMVMVEYDDKKGRTLATLARDLARLVKR